MDDSDEHNTAQENGKVEIAIDDSVGLVENKEEEIKSYAKKIVVVPYSEAKSKLANEEPNLNLADPRHGIL